MIGRFAFIEPRFGRDGCWTSLSHPALVLYSCLSLVADRHGLSSSSCEKIGGLLPLSLEDDLIARTALIKQDLIALDGPRFPGRSLPSQPVLPPARPLHSAQHMAHADPATIRQIIRHAWGADHD